MAYKLVYQYQGERKEFLLQGSSVTIGREPGNDVLVNDPSVSRRHACLRRDADRWRVVDTQSRNGVRVNGLQIDPGEVGARVLSDGDTLLLGALSFQFTREEAERLVLSEPAEGSTQTTITGVSDFKDLIDSSSAAIALPKEAEEALSRAKRVLSVVASIARRIAAVKPLEEVIESIIELVFESTPAERAALLLWDEAVQTLVPKIVRNRSGRNTGEIRVSRTIVRRAFEERCTVKMSPADALSRSMHGMGLRSAVAVPLWDQTRVIGVIYADSSRLAGAFDPFSVDLLSALAHHAAIAIEQARLLLRIQQEERARERLGRYLPPAVVKGILAAGDSSASGFSFPPLEAEATVLFSDMVNFTRASEALSPPEVMLMLNEYFSNMTEVIFEHEGTLDKYIGDCIMAVFGAPLPQADHARRAALTALGIREVVQRMNERRTGERMDFRIGMNSGKVVAGDLGHAKRKEWTVLGSTVNLASRMESSVARAGQIILTGDTRAQLGEEFEVRPVEFQQPKGIERPLEAFELIGVKD